MAGEKMRNNIVYILVLIFIFTGCSDNKQKQEKTASEKIAEISYHNIYENIKKKPSKVKKDKAITEKKLYRTTDKLKTIIVDITKAKKEMCEYDLKDCIKSMKTIPKNITIYKDNGNNFVKDDSKVKLPTTINLNTQEDDEEFLEVDFLDDHNYKYIKLSDLLNRSKKSCIAKYKKTCKN